MINRHVIAGCGAVAIIVTASAHLCAQRVSPQVSVYTQVHELLMPTRPQTLERAEWVVHIRVHERDAPELWLRVAKVYAEDAAPAYFVDARQIWPQPLDRQIDAIRTKSPSASVRRIADQVSQRAWRMGPCPAAISAIARLERFSVPVFMDDTLVLDPPNYELSGLFHGGRVEVESTGARATHDLEEAIRALASAVLSCR